MMEDLECLSLTELKICGTGKYMQDNTKKLKKTAETGLKNGDTSSQRTVRLIIYQIPNSQAIPATWLHIPFLDIGQRGHFHEKSSPCSHM